ncbi:hypothetical protein QBZ16_002393 [Prototheca wickerhamii]|uniref:Large ribosomal subunit protein bL21m n=1 Tax=Prototheca wickerhamii TaxID=3111 RepID=A0AAD9MMQ5_PROWI|nr:hypothetical protein QBZ16_002393 [Prototheca wickerhamii]
MAAQRLCAAFQRGLAPLASTRTLFSSAQLRTVQSVAETPNTATTSTPSSSPGPLFTLLSERITGPHTVPLKPVFAVVELAGTQYKVTPNDTIVTEKLSGVDVSEIISLDRVLLAGTASETIIGRPTVPGITVTAAVEEQFLDGKVLIFKKRRRKNSRRLNGHRQPLTMLRILDIQGVESA